MPKSKTCRQQRSPGPGKKKKKTDKKELRRKKTLPWWLTGVSNRQGKGVGIEGKGSQQKNTQRKEMLPVKMKTKED